MPGVPKDARTWPETMIQSKIVVTQ